MSIQVVWFKRDLRVTDHQPLLEASRRGAVLPVYVFEPDLLLAPDYAAQHYRFALECLAELADALCEIGLGLSVEHASMLDVLQRLRNEHGRFDLWSHEETGNGLSYQRDLAVGRWCRLHDIAWHEFPNNGVVRRLASRNRWSHIWTERMSNGVLRAPSELLQRASTSAIQYPSLTQLLDVRSPMKLGVRLAPRLRSSDDKPARQRGGRSHAIKLLDTFLQGRGADYRRAMSSPTSASQACSRLSPYLALGVLSVRELVHALADTRAAFIALPREQQPSRLLTSLRSFESRLHWHCHFIQKLESQPEMEFVNLHRAYDSLRTQPCESSRFDSWARGETGFPMIDACMRMLIHTGWINFRMRAMLVSFASYQLWLHWREPALHLARQFLDYEPGIHYPQVQMQSGTTGINTIRMYNPVKQARDHDPTGQFVRRWIPALARLPDAFIFEPWKTPIDVQQRNACLIGRDYPPPIIDLVPASRLARDAVWSVRKDSQFRAEAQAIFEQHGSRHPRREGIKQGTRKRASAAAADQAVGADQAADEQPKQRDLF